MKKSKVRRKQNHIFYIIWEWKTECAYFSALARLCRFKNVTIYTRDFEWTIWKGDPDKKIISTRIKNIEFWLKQKDVEIDKKDKRQHICYLLDTDVYNKNWINHIAKIMWEKWIHVYFSNKCFELFLLEHIGYYCKEKDSSVEYIKDLKKTYPKYDKWDWIKTTSVCEDLIKNKLSAVKQNFKKLKKVHESNKKTHICDMNPYSEVIDLLENIGWISGEF